jgi:hypothetical protein
VPLSADRQAFVIIVSQCAFGFVTSGLNVHQTETKSKEIQRKERRGFRKERKASSSNQLRLFIRKIKTAKKASGEAFTPYFFHICPFASRAKLFFFPAKIIFIAALRTLRKPLRTLRLKYSLR